MGLTFGNPWGLLALLGIPALLAIHFLQRRPVVIPVSTLFLLKQLSRESEAGRGFERLRTSLPLWLQLTGVLLLTWLLTDPLWLEKTSVQRIAVVLDGSASMTVARPAVLTSLPADLDKLARATAQSEVHLIDSRMEKAPLYHGPGSGPEMMQALNSWIPAGGSHDPGPALRLARNLAGREGVVVFVSDAPLTNLPPGVRMYACGQPVENVGIAGVTVEESGPAMEWQATLRNYSTGQQTRRWQVSAGAQVLSEEDIVLSPGSVVQKRGIFPGGAETLELSLSADAFPMDDKAPLIRPKLKEVTLSLTSRGTANSEIQKMLEPMFASLPGVMIAAEGGDVMVTTHAPGSGPLPDAPGIVFLHDPGPDNAILKGAVLVEKHPMTTGLGWQSLICQDVRHFTPGPADQVLVWMGERPVLFLRTIAGRSRQLCFNFDLTKSNARRLPALVLTLHRWVEDFRQQWPAEEWTLTECSQALNLAVNPSPAPPELTLKTPGPANIADLTVPAREAPFLRAPDQPGFLEVWQGDTRLLRTATHFADVREADFTRMATQQDLAGAANAITRQHSQQDPAWRGWVLALLGVIGFSWWWLGRPARSSREQRLQAGNLVPEP